MAAQPPQLSMGQPPAPMMGPPQPGPPASMGPLQPGMGQPPVSMMGPPQPGMGQPPASMGGMPQRPNIGMPPQPGMPAASMGGMPPRPGMGMPPQPGMGQPPSSMGGMPPPQPGMGMPPQPNMGMPPQPNMGMPPQPGMPPSSMGGMPPQPGMGGMPPQPGMGGMGGQPGMGGMGGQPGYPGMGAPQRKGLDPDSMPNPIQVMADDRAAHNTGQFLTNEKGKVPPLVTPPFLTQDQGHCAPSMMRATMDSVPDTPDMKKQTAVPLGLVLTPLARLKDGEYPIPVVDLGQLGPVRCSRCKAYMSPYMTFTDGGKRFQCSFCKATTEVPQ